MLHVFEFAQANGKDSPKDHINSNNSDEKVWELVIDEDDQCPSYIEEHQRHLHTQQSLDLCLFLRVLMD